MIKVIKRNGQEVDFDANKIAIAINKAMHSSTGVYEEGLAEKIASEIETFATTIGNMEILQPPELMKTIRLCKLLKDLKILLTKVF